MRSAFFVAASTGAFPTPRRRTGSSPSSHSAAAAVPSSSSAASFASSSTVAAVRHLDEYRRNVGICLVNASGKVFAARCACVGDKCLADAPGKVFAARVRVWWGKKKPTFEREKKENVMLIELADEGVLSLVLLSLLFQKKLLQAH